MPIGRCQEAERNRQCSMGMRGGVCMPEQDFGLPENGRNCGESYVWCEVC